MKTILIIITLAVVVVVVVVEVATTANPEDCSKGDWMHWRTSSGNYLSSGLELV